MVAIIPDMTIDHFEVERDWIADARCRDQDTRWFFPDACANLDERRGFCALCPVRDECLEFAVNNSELGWWGGTDEKERRSLRGQHYVRSVTVEVSVQRSPGGKPLNHGTEYAWKHCGPPKCQDCRDAKYHARVRRGETSGTGHKTRGKGRYSSV